MSLGAKGEVVGAVRKEGYLEDVGELSGP